MGEVISFSDRHHSVQQLIPWYVTGQLNGEEKASLEGHLDACADCAAALKSERQIRAAVAGASFDADRGWNTLKARLETALDDAPQGSAPWKHIGSYVFQPKVMKRLVAAQGACIVVLAGVSMLPSPKAEYRALSNAPAIAVGNALVMFRADATEAQLRHSLQASGARLVDGPTAANAYLIEVPSAHRDREIAHLRVNPVVTMAEPVDRESP